MATEDRITEHYLYRETKSIAEEIIAEFREQHGAASPFDPEEHREDLFDRALETADGHQWVIYYQHAIQLCAECDTTLGEEFLEDCGGTQAGDTFQGIAAKIAFGELHGRIGEELEKLIEAASAQGVPRESQES